MSHATTLSEAVSARTQTADQSRFWRIFGLTLLAVLAVSIGNLVDPIVRYDDYPALFAEPEGFWWKTLAEGRWVNYIWHLRGVVTPAWLNFAVYQGIWALLCAALTVAVLPGPGRMWFAAVLSLTLAVAPPALFIAPWFNTLLPGLAIITAYALIGLRVSQRRLRLLLPVFTVASFMAYTTFPLILLMVCIARTPRRSLRDLAGLVLLFCSSFVGAVALTYALNWQVHGVFGVVLDASRDPTGAHDLAGLVANLGHLGDTFSEFLRRSSFGFVPLAVFHLILLGLSTCVLARRAPLEALYWHAALWIGIALIVVQSLKLGVYVPARAFLFAWMIYAVLILRSTEILSASRGFSGRMSRNAVLLITLSYLLQSFNQWVIFRDWQHETRSIADELTAYPDPVYLVGEVMALPSADKAGIQNPIAFQSRMQQLRGRRVTVCDIAPGACAELDLPDLPKGARMSVLPAEGVTFVLVPTGG